MVDNPYLAYKQQSVMTMTKGELLLALYDGILKEIEFSKQAFSSKDLAEINRRLQKVQLMIGHLKTTLDFQYEVSNDLDRLYGYLLNVVLQANLKKDPQGLDEVSEMITELRDTFAKADRKTRTLAVTG